MAAAPRIPVLATTLWGVAAAMAAPALMATIHGDEATGRGFLYAGLFTAVSAGILRFALHRPRTVLPGPVDELLTLVLAWLVVPVFAAIPLVLVTPSIGIRGALFETIACFTTTGGTGYGRPAEVPGPVHLWRGIVGWLGGILTLTAAWVVLAPRRLGGFEIEAATWRAQSDTAPRNAAMGIAPVSIDDRIARAVRVILPTYAVLTGVLALMLSASGQGGLAAAVHAMAILSTSGISPFADGFAADPKIIAELWAAVFMVLASTRLIYADASAVGSRVGWLKDPELWTMAALVGLVSVTLFLRHWIGALTFDLGTAPIHVLDAAWGTVFTAISFASTTGFESGFWESARDWSGLENPGLILLGLAAIGGGAATTAGGIKLIRAYALVRHGLRELERIAQPNSVIGIGARTRSLLREGPVIVWTFIMLFIFAILVTVLALTATGLGFEVAVVAAIAAISNTGPALELVSEPATRFADLTQVQRMILAVTMLAGRIELLALIALFNPDAWRRRPGRGKRAGKSPAQPSRSGW